VWLLKFDANLMAVMKNLVGDSCFRREWYIPFGIETDAVVVVIEWRAK